MQGLIIVPTYNERENITDLVQQIFLSHHSVHVLVVDDNSPDGTGGDVERLKKNQPRLHLLERPGKMGLGKAYLAGFKWGLEKDYDYIVEMDADFSHRVEDLGKILKQIESGSDFVVGSRYVSGGGTVNWGLFRKLISRGGSFYSSMLLGWHIHDWTGGFNAWQRRVLEGISLDEVRSEGYSFQIELKYRAIRKKFKCTEVPILFEDRRVGKSKMSSHIVFEALLKVWQLKIQVP